jgi:hypothetical protein
MYTLIHIIGWALIALAVFMFVRIIKEEWKMVSESVSRGEPDTVMRFVSDTVGGIVAISFLSILPASIGVACLLVGVAP